MKLTNAEILKTKSKETIDTGQMLEEARMNVQKVEFEATDAENEARSLELELMKAQAAHERREEAERQGKESNEKIAELTG